MINTITSHNLLKDIKEAEADVEEKDLFSELMATSANMDLEGIASEYVE